MNINIECIFLIRYKSSGDFKTCRKMKSDFKDAQIRQSARASYWLNNENRSSFLREFLLISGVKCIWNSCQTKRLWHRKVLIIGISDWPESMLFLLDWKSVTEGQNDGLASLLDWIAVVLGAKLIIWYLSFVNMSEIGSMWEGKHYMGQISIWACQYVMKNRSRKKRMPESKL